MKLRNIRVFQRINKKYCGYVIGFIVFMWITSTIFAIQAIRQPLVIEEKIVNNIIEEKTSFDYEAIVKPSTLYSNGGRIIPDKIIFNNLTDELIIKLDANINSEKPVKVEGTSEIVFSLVAIDMWEREFILNPTENIKTEGVSNSLLSKEVHISLEDIFNYINIVEEETLVRPNYMLIIKPKIIGNVYEDNEVVYELSNKLEIPFEISGQYIKYAVESEVKELINTKEIEVINQVPQNFNFLGIKLLIIGAKYGFSITSLMSFLLILIYIIEKLKLKKGKFDNINLIDKKNKNKIIVITEKVDFNTLPKLSINSFKDLLKIAEEKEESIFKYADDTIGIIYYYIVGSTFIYSYQTANNIIGEGSELAHDI